MARQGLLVFERVLLSVQAGIGNIKFPTAHNKYFAFQQNFKNFAITNEGPEKSHANASTLFFCLVLSNNIVHLFYFIKLRKLGEEQRNLPAWMTTGMVYQMVVVYQSSYMHHTQKLYLESKEHLSPSSLSSVCA